MSTTTLWYLSRSTGFVLLIVLSFTMILGIIISRRASLPGLPSFAVIGLHRNASLLAVVLLAIHVTTAVIDSFVPIQWLAVLLPFTSHYEPVWLGLGALTLDLLLAIVVTSLLRERVGRRVWRTVHLLGYVAFPLAAVHGIGAASDLQSGVLLAVAVGCLAAVAGTAAWRLVEALRVPPPRGRALAQLTAVEAAGSRR